MELNRLHISAFGVEHEVHFSKASKDSLLNVPYSLAQEAFPKLQNSDRLIAHNEKMHVKMNQLKGKLKRKKL